MDDAVSRFREIELQVGSISAGMRQIDPGPLRQVHVSDSQSDIISRMASGRFPLHSPDLSLLGSQRIPVSPPAPDDASNTADQADSSPFNYMGLSFLQGPNFRVRSLEESLQANNAGIAQQSNNPYAIIEKHLSESIEKYSAHQSIENVANSITQSLHERGIDIENIYSLTIDKNEAGDFKVKSDHQHKQAIESVLKDDTDTNIAMNKLWQKTMVEARFGWSEKV